MMSVPQAMVLGLVEGLTEYLPVSSTGHLILAQRAMGIGGDHGDKEAADAYAVCIQLGAILAVLGLYAGDIRRIGLGLIGRDPGGLHLGRNLLIAFLPAAIVGLSFVDKIKEHLFGLWPVVVAWFMGGLAILIVDRWKIKRHRTGSSDIYELSAGAALIIGAFQCIAVWPGVSRSLVTIVGALVVGMRLDMAVVFSFLLGAITLGASTAYDGLLHGNVLLEAYGLPSIFSGFAVAFVSALLAIRWMVAYLRKHGLALFGYYRVGLAIITGTLLATNLLH